MTAADLLGQRPRLHPDVLVGAATRRGPDVLHLVRRGAGPQFEVGAKEHFLLSRLDGGRTLAEIGAEYAVAFGRRLGEAQWRHLLQLLSARRLLDGTEPAVPAGDGAASPGVRRSGLASGTIRLFSDPARYVERWHRRLAPALSARVAVPVVGLVAAMEVLVAANLGQLWRETRELFTQPVLLLAVCTLLWVSMALHELAHGVVARRYGGRVSEIGIRWHLPLVIMYCEVENYAYLRSRRHRVLIAGAGGLTNLVFVLPFAPVWLLVPPGEPVRAAAAGLLLLGSVQGLANYLPVPPMDGYKMLSHALGMSGLAAESRRFLGLAVRSAVGRGGGVGRYPQPARVAYAAFGLGVALVQLGSAAGLVLVTHLLSADRYGLGLTLAVAGLLGALATGVVVRRHLVTRHERRRARQ